MSTLAILFIGFLVILFYFSRKPKNFPPGPRRFPIIGTFLRQPKHEFENIIDIVGEMVPTYGKTIGFYLFHRPTVFVHDPAIVRKMFNLEVFSGRPNDATARTRRPVETDRMMGTIMNEGESWQAQKRFLLRTLKDLGFGKKGIESTLQEEALDLVNYLKQHENKEFLVSNLFNISVVNIIWSIVASVRFSLDDPSGQEILDQFSKNFKRNTMAMQLLPFMRYLPPWSSGFNILIETMRKVQQMIRVQLEEHKETLDKENPRDLIDHYLIKIETDDCGGEFDENQLIMNSVDLFAAGSETTATTLKWALLFLSTNIEAQTKCRREIHTTIGLAKTPSLDDMKNLPYCEATIMEIQRMGCIARTSLQHRTMADTEFNGHFYPKDTLVLANIQYIMESPEYWKEPLKFQPERFLNEKNEVIRDLPAFMPFSQGRRMCLGDALAKQELSIFVTTLIQNLEFLPSKYGIKPDPKEYILGITKIPKDYHIIVKVADEIKN